jgi:broad specificity phosphatase PhoE
VNKKKPELGELIDTLYALRTKRLALERKAETAAEPLKAQEKALETQLINEFSKGELDGAKGKRATAAVQRATVASVRDWEEFYAWLGKTKSWDMMQRRVNNAAYRERLDAHKPVPGVEPFVSISLSITKR